MRTQRLIAALLIAIIIILLAVLGCNDHSNDDDGNHDDQNDGDDDDATADDDDDDSDVERLYAGTGRGRLQVPIGISMSGNGLREGPRTHYSGIMGGSEGYYDRPSVKALSLKKGDRWLVFATAAICFPTESMRTQVVGMVFDRTGVDLDRGLIITGNHTHSGPGRYFGIPDILGMTGLDIYHQEIADRIAESYADVIVESIESIAPARIGFGYLEGLDPEEHFTSDRSCQNGPGSFKEDRLWVGRVETDTGSLLSILVSMAMHGVIYKNTFMTGDAPAGVERAIEALFNHPVTTLYIQGSAGDVTPRPESPVGHESNQIVEWTGYQIARFVKGVLDTIETDDQPELEVITRRLNYNRNIIGYPSGEFGHWGPEGFAEYGVGAMLCGQIPMDFMGSIVDCDNPDTSLKDGYLGCPVDLGWVQFEPYLKYFQQSPITVVRIGDHFFFTNPGEITSHLAVDTRKKLAEDWDIPFEKINTIGYAQNHLFYLLQDWDWLQGGYATTMTLFGWKFGPYLIEQVSELTGQLLTPDQEPNDDPDANLFYRIDQEIPPEKGIETGVVQIQPIAVNQRFDTIEFVWHGGHPGVDLFTVVLQQRQGDEFMDVKRANGLIYDDQGWEMRVRLTPQPTFADEFNRQERDFLYSLAWETSWDDPEGVLRFKVSGKTWNGREAVAYEVFSDQFTLSSSADVTLNNLEAIKTGQSLSISLDAVYPPNPQGWRLRSPIAGGTNPAYVTGGQAEAQVTVVDHEPVSVLLTYDEQTESLTGTVDVVESGREHLITAPAGAFNDGFGNTNTTAAQPYSITP